MTIKDQNSAKQIETQMRRLQRLQDSVAQWKAKLLSNGRKCEERNKALKEEKDAISKHFQVLLAPILLPPPHQAQPCSASAGAQGQDEQVPREGGPAPAGAHYQLAGGHLILTLYPSRP